MRFGPPDVNNFNHVKEKKMMGLCYETMKENCVEGSWIHSGNGPFRGQQHVRPIIHKKKKTQRTKSAYEMKEVGSCSPNSEALEDCALVIDVGFIGQKLTCYKPTTMGLEQLLPNGSDFFFISIVT